MHRSVTAVMVVCGLVGLDAPPAAALDRDAWIFPATPSAGPRISQSRGDQKVLVISIETADQLVPAGTWPPTATRARQIAEELNRDFMAASYGRMGLTFIYVPEVIRIPGVKADYRFFAWETYPATTIAKTLDARYDLAQVDRVWLVNNLNRCGTGCAYIGGKEFGNNLARDGVARHEINHTNGLNHGGSFSPVDGNPYDTSVFLDNVGDDIGAVHMRAGTRYHLRWQIDNDPQGFGPRAVSSSAAAAGLHALVDVASGEPTPGQFRGLRFPRMVPAGSTWPASGFQSYMVGFSESDVGIHVQAVADLLPGGLDTRMVHGGFLLGQDISGPDAGRIERLALRVGRSTLTPEGIAISPLLIQPGAGGEPARCLTDVRPGPFPGNRAPTLNLTMEPAQPVVGSVVRLQAAASDPDGDLLSYHWVVGGASRLSTSADATVLETTPLRAGTTVYRVEVHDRRGGVISRSVTVAVPAITAPSGTFYVDGTVADSNTGRPLPGAEVAFAGRTKITGADGRYVFPNVPEGTYNGNDRPRVTLGHYPTRFLSNSGSSFIVATGRRMTNENVRLARAVADPVDFMLATTQVIVDEGATALIRVVRSGNAGVPIHLRYLLMADRAEAGRDFIGSNGILTIPAGTAEAAIAIATRTDAVVDPGERLLVAITGIEAPYPIATPVNGPAPIAEILIRDAGDGGPGSNAAPVIDRIQADADRKVLP